MGKLFALDADIKRVITDALDDLLANEKDGGLGKTCRLVYPPRSVPCNCVKDPVGGKHANRPVGGAPVPFTATQPCPVCNGEGRREDEVSEEITLKCNWEMKKFFFPVRNLELRVPHSVVEVKGYLKDLPKIMKCDHLVLNLPVEPYLRQKFTLAGEPGDPSNIVQGRYFVAALERMA